VAKYEMYGTRACPFTSEMREWLEWQGHDYVEYDVEADDDALARMLAISGGQRSVPVLVEDGKLNKIGWEGRSCIVEIRRA
jgi:glutaredoxin